MSNETKALTERIRALEAALQPFVEAASWFELAQNYLDTDPICYKEKFGLGECRVEVGHLRAAKRALLDRPAPAADPLADDDEDGADAPCTNPGGHDFQCSGTAYGGDDESYHGEGRSYCIWCGADGDA